MRLPNFLSTKKGMSIVAVLFTLMGAAGSVAYSKLSSSSCCYPGSPCCYPGAPCCANAHH